MGKPTTLLEGLCGHALSLGFQSISVEYKDGEEQVFVMQNLAGLSTDFQIASYRSCSPDGKELRTNLYAAAKKPVRAVFDGKVYLLKVRLFDSFGEDAFDVKISLAPRLDASESPSFTKKQGQYLAFIHHYTKIHRQAPAETDLERYFQVSAPSIHGMVKTLERNGLIEKIPGKARSIRLLVQPDHLPPLD